MPNIDKDTIESFVKRRRGKVQEWTSVQWLKWQKSVIKEELNELALSKKVEKPNLVLLSNKNLNNRTKIESNGMNVITLTGNATNELKSGIDLI